MSWGPVDVVKDFLRQQSVAALSNTYGISKHDVEEMLRDAIRSPVKWADAPAPSQPPDLVPCVKCGTLVAESNRATHCAPAPSQGTGEARCPECGGYGERTFDVLRGEDHDTETVECPKCHGTGRRDEKK